MSSLIQSYQRQTLTGTQGQVQYLHDKKVPSRFSWVKKKVRQCFACTRAEERGVKQHCGPTRRASPTSLATPSMVTPGLGRLWSFQPLGSSQISDHPWLQTCQNLPAGSVRDSLIQIAPIPLAVAWDGSWHRNPETEWECTWDITDGRSISVNYTPCHTRACPQLCPQPQHLRHGCFGS